MDLRRDIRPLLGGARAIRVLLGFLVIACVLPAWLAGGYLLYFSYQGQLSLNEQTMQQTAKALMMVVDRELASIQASLEALATSPSLAAGDLASFHGQAREVLRKYPESDIILADASGQQLVNTFRPIGSSLPRRNTDAASRVFETGKPCISDLFKGAVTGRPLIGVDVPVIIDGRVVYDLAMTASADRLTNILLQQNLPPQWVGIILDSKRSIVARTKDPERFVGQFLPRPPYLRTTPDGMGGISEGGNIEGVIVRAGFSRSAMSGWTVAVNTPPAVLMANMRQWILWFSAMAVALIAAGLGIAFVVGRSIAGDVRKLAEGARHVAGGNLERRMAGGMVSELAELSGTFNDMVSALAAARARQQEHQAELERLVEDRTATLREREEQLGLFIEHAPAAIAMFDTGMRYQAVSRRWLSDYRLEGRDILGRSHYDIFPEILDRWREIHRRCLAGAVERAEEDPFVRADGTMQWLRWEVRPWYDKAGAIGGIAIFTEDITERKLAMDELRKAKQEVDQALAEISFISEATNLGLWSAEMPLNILGWNRQVKEHFWLSPEHEPTMDGFFAALHPGDRVGARKAIEDALDNNATLDITYRALSRDGREKWIHAQGRATYDEDGRPARFSGITQDVTAQRRMEEELRRSRDELEKRVRERTLALEQKNQELQDFTSIASHDLQEPLRKVQAFGERLRANHADALGDKGRDYLMRMENAARRMQTLLHDLLEYSRVTTQTHPFARADLTEVVREAVEDLEGRQEETGGRIDVGTLPSAEVDVVQMRQVFQNLLSNSLKYHGEEPPLVTVTGETAGSEVRIAVADNGIGFEEKYLDKIFQPFQRLHGKSQYAGTGIGLAIVRKIVERHGGRIIAESAPGAGSRFIVTLPAEQPGRDVTSPA